MGNQQAKVSDIDIGWLAGFIDGEGWTSFRVGNHRGKTQIQPLLSFCNTDVDSLTRATAILDGLELGYHVQWRESKRRTGEFTKHLWKIEIQGFKRIVRAHTALRPYLTIKGKGIDILFDFVHSRIGKSSMYGQEIKGGHGDLKGAEPYSEYEWELVAKLKKLNSISHSIRN